MPKRNAVDRQLVLDTYAATGSPRQAANAAGSDVSTVMRLVRQSRGLCARCPTPAAPDHVHCGACLQWIRARAAARRGRQRAAGRCVSCDRPAVTGVHCEDHRIRTNRQSVARRVRRLNEEGSDLLERQRAYTRRAIYGEAANTVWNRTSGGCMICGAPYQPRRAHIHHIDGDHGNQVEANMIVLCHDCHRLAHALAAHANPQAVIDWARKAHGLPTPDHLRLRFMGKQHSH